MSAELLTPIIILVIATSLITPIVLKLLYREKKAIPKEVLAAGTASAPLSPKAASVSMFSDSPQHAKSHQAKTRYRITLGGILGKHL